MSRKPLLLSVTVFAALAMGTTYAEEEQASCFADSYADRIRTELEESAFETENELDNLEATAANEEALEAEAACSADFEDPAAVFLDEEDDFDIPHLSFGELEEDEEDVVDSLYEWEHEASSDDTSASFWDDLEEEMNSNETATEDTLDPTQGEA